MALTTVRDYGFCLSPRKNARFTRGAWPVPRNPSSRPLPTGPRGSAVCLLEDGQPAAGAPEDGDRSSRVGTPFLALVSCWDQSQGESHRQGEGQQDSRRLS